MSKKYLNTIPLEETIKRLHDGEKIFNDDDADAYVKYVDGLGICKFRQKTDELLVANFTLSLFSQLYFNDLKEDYGEMIGCVGWFWDYAKDCKVIGILTDYNKKMQYEYFCRNSSVYYSHFRPAKKSELKFYGEEKDE